MWAQPHKEKTGDREETVIVCMHCYCSAYYFYNHFGSHLIMHCVCAYNWASPGSVHYFMSYTCALELIKSSDGHVHLSSF